MWSDLLREEVADETAVIFVLDPSEEFSAELLYGVWAVEWQLLILRAGAEVTRHTLGLKYGFDLAVEIYAGIRTRARPGLPVWGSGTANFGF
jgi:hypothetical protein